MAKSVGKRSPKWVRGLPAAPNEGGTSVQIDDIHRRIRNILVAYPATEWTLEESCSVLENLASIVRARQSMGDVVDLGA